MKEGMEHNLKEFVEQRIGVLLRLYDVELMEVVSNEDPLPNH